jgi:hypothetical protein
LAVGDLDGDQIPDLAVANSATDNVAVLLGNGDGSFGLAAFFSAGVEPQSVAIGDLNGDQHADLAVANFSSLDVEILLGVGDGRFGTFHFFRVMDGPRSVAIGDLNGDQVPDLAVAGTGVGVLLGVSDGTFGTAGFYGTDLFALSLAIGDLDGDQILDLVSAGDVRNVVATLRGVGDGTFRPDSTVQSGGTPRSVAIGDLNGDQIPDLAVAYFSADSVAILLGVGNGTFNQATFFSAGDGPQSVVIADLNGDKHSDLVVANNLSDNIAVLLGAGGGTFEPAVFYGAGDGPSSLAVADLNGDPLPDLAVADALADSVGILLGTGNGIFSGANFYEAGDEPRAIAIGHLNGDQAADLAVANLFSRDVAVLLGDGDGGFGSPSFLAVGDSARSVAIGDLNDDQHSDLAVTAGAMVVLPGNGEGGFGPAQLYGSGKDPMVVAIADLNGDQLPDLASGRSRAAILLAYRAPLIAVEPASLSFPTVTTGDAVPLDITIWNYGETRVPITHVTFPSPEMRAEGSLPLYIDAGGSKDLHIVLEPRERLDATGELRLFTISPPATAVPVQSDIRPLAVSSRRDPPDELVEQGQEVTVTVTPEDHVRVESGSLYYTITGSDVRFSVALVPVGEDQDFAATIPGIHVTELGLDYYVQVQNSGVIATDPQGAPDSTYAVGVRFTSDPLPDSGPRLEGQPINVITSFTSIDSGSLHYRRAGDHAYHTVSINTEGHPVATIPDSFVGARGVEYWMEIMRDTERQTDPPGQDPGARPRTIRVTAEGLREEQDYPGDGLYRMVSVPLDLDSDVTLEALLSDQSAFGPYDPLKWRSFRYAMISSEPRYVELSEAGLDEVHWVMPGKAFWLASKEPGMIDTAPITGTSTPTDSLFCIALTPGWNQIGNPFLFPVAWDSILVAIEADTFSMSEVEAVRVEPPLAWVDQKYVPIADRILQPFAGYWAKSLVGADTTVCLLVPPREASAGQARTPPASAEDEAKGWTISIRATAAGSVDDVNLVGVSPDAVSTWDTRDRSEPPMAPGESISLYFPHTAWEVHPGRYTIDVRGAYEPLAAVPGLAALLPDPEAWGHVWRFDVAKSSTRAGVDVVQLDFTEIDVPKEALITLLDRHLGTVVDLRTDARHAFYLGAQPAAATEESARFVLVVGSAAFRDAAIGELPAAPVRTFLYPTYPNPFNPATLIRFDIAHSGPVEVGIYDIRGALVKALTEGHRASGRYEISWNGEDHDGNRVASGIYFCRLTGDNFSEARKMIMLR